MQKFTKAVEEAKEVQDRRIGLQPLTDHDPIDFLDPSTFPSSDSDDASNDGPSARKVDLRPAPMSKEDAIGLKPHDALTFLLAAARGDTSVLSMVSYSVLTTFMALGAIARAAGQGQGYSSRLHYSLSEVPLFCCAGQQREREPVQAACLFSHG